MAEFGQRGIPTHWLMYASVAAVVLERHMATVAPQRRGDVTPHFLGAGLSRGGKGVQNEWTQSMCLMALVDVEAQSHGVATEPHIRNLRCWQLPKTQLPGTWLPAVNCTLCKRMPPLPT